MKRHLNTLFVMTQGSYLSKDHESVVVAVEREERLRLPIHNLGSIVCFGNVLCSPYLLGHCAQKDVSVSFLTEHGRFLASVNGEVRGNVLVRRQQYRMADNPAESCRIAKWIITGKVVNIRSQLKRHLRDYHPSGHRKIEQAILVAKQVLKKLPFITELNRARGYEGEASRAYFSVFDHLIVQQKTGFRFSGRTRRPPLDAVNALLSFAYTILLHDVRSALETVGLDPAVGYLHRDRPGRPSLALDLMEEFRPWFADRIVLNLINRTQISPTQFERTESGAIHMDDDARKTFLSAYQDRKQEEIRHPFLEENVTVGLLFFTQALLFARFVRGEIDAYPPFLPR